MFPTNDEAVAIYQAALYVIGRANARARMPRLAEYARVMLPNVREPKNGFPCPRELREPIGGTPIGNGNGMLIPSRR